MFSSESFQGILPGPAAATVQLSLLNVIVPAVPGVFAHLLSF
jgi:hypothetical protein